MRVRNWAASFVLVLAIAIEANASLLGLTFLPPPDITVGFIDVDYNAGTQTFSAQGFAQQMDDGIVPNNPILAPGYNFFLSALVDNTGVLTPGGSFSVTGSVTLNSITYGLVNPLLTGTVAAFGFGDTPANYDILEFVIELTGGDLAIPAYYGVPGTLIGLDFDANYGGAFTGSFAASFDNTGGFGPGFGNGQSDIKPIPEPTALALFGLAALALVRRRSPAN
ncbi:MAG: hypothetical protein HBSAPP02_09540 [Phycisphaerae bacterium]|nr:MAG: PEP-CTERM sorting domain-containing protein [Planctomycetia bacterium]RIK69686.1 MAG: hypothetical protein DCC66_07960 [Planctomycetota bacterium]GJQ25922.1 MAG: hypothetical protein HBSAPP02_09540 [Phycisphaerae bacterium]